MSSGHFLFILPLISWYGGLVPPPPFFFVLLLCSTICAVQIQLTSVSLEAQLPQGMPTSSRSRWNPRGHLAGLIPSSTPCLRLPVTYETTPLDSLPRIKPSFRFCSMILVTSMDPTPTYQISPRTTRTEMHRLSSFPSARAIRTGTQMSRFVQATWTLSSWACRHREPNAKTSL